MRSVQVAFVCAVASGCGRIDFAVRDDAARSDGSPPVDGLPVVDACGGSWRLVPNGSFETGDTTDWLDFDIPMYGTAVGVQDPVVGSWSIRMTPSMSVLNGYSLRSPVAVVENTSYVLSGYLRTERLTGGQSFYLDLNDTPFEIDALAANGVPGWQFVSGQVDIPAGVTMVTVRVVHDGQLDPSQSADVDEVALTPVAQFVVPPCP